MKILHFYPFFIIVIILLSRNLKGAEAKDVAEHWRKAEITLSSSLSLDCLKKMGLMKQHNVNLGVCVDERMRDLIIEIKHGVVYFRFFVGDAFTVKLIKALSYHFDGLQFLDENSFPPDAQLDAILYVELLDAGMSVKKQVTRASVYSEGHLSIKGTIRDKKNSIIWVGTVKTEGKGIKWYASGNNLLGDEQLKGIEQAIDLAIANLINQMFLSNNMKNEIIQWEND